MWVESLFRELRSHSRGELSPCAANEGAHGLQSPGATTREKPKTKITSAATKTQRSKK